MKTLHWTPAQWRKFAEMCKQACQQTFPGIRFADAAENAEQIAENIERRERELRPRKGKQ